MEMDRREVTRPPLKWQERIEELLYEDMPDAPYFASWVSGKVNWNIPVVNPWDYSKRYTIQSAPFNPHWVLSMVRICEEYLKLSIDKLSTPLAWYPHKHQIKDVGKVALRSFNKMKHWGFLEPCPPEALLHVVPVTDEETGEVYANTSGRYQPTEYMFAFISNKLRVPRRIHTFKGKLIGMSESKIGMADALIEFLGYSDFVSGESEEYKCEVCESNEDLYKFTTDEHEIYTCKTCVLKERDEKYNELIRFIRGEVLAMRRSVNGKQSMADDLAQEWEAKFSDFYQPSRDGVTVDASIDLDIGTRGSIALPEDSLRRFLNKREKRRRKLAAEKEKQDD